jgi:DNA (cytosine-5)-methyltransferase 1
MHRTRRGAVVRTDEGESLSAATSSSSFRSSDRRWQFADVFCGGGGASCGATLAGFTVVSAVDSWPEALACHAENHPGCVHTCAAMPDAEVRIARRGRNAHLHVHVSPPCQALSTANYANYEAGPNDARFAAHRRAMEMIQWAIDFADSTGDTWSFEQVVRREIMNMFRARGIPYCVVDACYFGVGQQRKRLIAGSPAFVEGVRAVMEADRPTVTAVRDVLPTKGTHMRNRVYSATVTSETGERVVVPASVDSQLRSFDRPSWTITGNSPPRWYCRETGKTTYLTCREMATLQGFPPTYSFDAASTVRSRSVVIGNAVPPPIISAGLKAVRTAVVKEREEERRGGALRRARRPSSPDRQKNTKK